MGSITDKIFQLLSEGADYEQSRSTGIIIKSKLDWFGAIDGQGTSESNPVQAEGVGDIKEGKSTEVSEIDEQAKWLLLINQK